MGVSGGQRRKSILTGSIARYGHIDAHALWPQPSCGGCRQKPTHVSSSKTHRSQEPCLMAPDKWPGAISMALACAMEPDL